jgi:hypothetical protein
MSDGIQMSDLIQGKGERLLDGKRVVTDDLYDNVNLLNV